MQSPCSVHAESMHNPCSGSWARGRAEKGLFESCSAETTKAAFAGPAMYPAAFFGLCGAPPGPRRGDALRAVELRVLFSLLSTLIRIQRYLDQAHSHKM